jgi:CheY-like chemotaxis protein
MSGRGSGAAARRVLIVEDAPSCAETLDAALCAIPGISLTFASTAEEALDELLGGAFRALITDLNLPRMSGLQLIACVRGDPRFQSMPVIVISGDPDPDAPQRAFLAGANVFLSKPFSPSAVSKILEDLLDEP